MPWVHRVGASYTNLHAPIIAREAGKRKGQKSGQKSGNFLCPGTKDRAHQDESGKRIELINGKKGLRAHFEHVAHEGNRANETDPNENADGCAASSGIGIAPEA